MSKMEQSTLREWMLENLKEDLETIVDHGCEGGISGLTYYHETSDLYDAYQEEIWEILAEQAEASGYDNSVAFIASMNGVKQVADQTTFENLLLWYAIEELARQITAEKEDEIFNEIS